MEYNSKGLSDYARRIADIGGIAAIDLMHFATAWDEEVSALKKDKSELRELCRLMVFRENRKSDRFKDLWAKHMKGTAEKTKRKEQE